MHAERLGRQKSPFPGSRWETAYSASQRCRQRSGAWWETAAVRILKHMHDAKRGGDGATLKEILPSSEDIALSLYTFVPIVDSGEG